MSERPGFDDGHDVPRPSAVNGNGLGALAAALAKAQAAFPKVLKDRTAKIASTKGEYSYKYSDLASLLDAVRKPLSDNGLALTQPIEIVDKAMVLHTMLLHVSGAHVDSYYPLAAHERPQEMGSEITYSRRYTAGSILGIASEEDDDGAAAQKAAVLPGRYRGKGPVITRAAEEIGRQERREPIPEAELDAETRQAFPEDVEITRERQALLKRAVKLREALGWTEDSPAWLQGRQTYCGQASKDNVDPAALQEFVAWLEARATAKGVPA